MLVKMVFKKIYDWLDGIFSKNENEIIDEQKKEIDSLNTALKHLEKDWVALNDKNIELSKEINTVEKVLLVCQDDRDRHAETIRRLLEEDAEVKQPTFLKGKCSYKPRRRFVSKTKDFHVTFEQPQDTFDKSVYLTRKMKENNWIATDKSYKTMKDIHKWIITQLKYENDQFDNWRPVTETLLAGKIGGSDCEDGSIVITSALGMAGWKADEVFTAIGWHISGSRKSYHAFTIAKAVGKWWILESTNPNAIPMTYPNPNYTIDFLINWKFANKLYGDLK